MFPKHVWILTICFALYTNSTLAQNKDWCETYQNDTYPKRNTECYMEVNPNDKFEFVDNIIKSGNKLNFWTLTLQFENFDGTKRYWNKTNCVFQPLHWVWTYPGKDGAVTRLTWPLHYGIWSLGILAVDWKYVPQNITIKVNGTCPVTIGKIKTTEQIGLALIEMANNSDFIKMRTDIKYSYICYTEQIWINTINLYRVCLHMICPINNLGRKCCRTGFDFKTRRNRVVCEAKPIVYETIWWQFPYVIGYLMFLYFPFVLLSTICRYSIKTDFRLQNDGSVQLEFSQTIHNRQGWLISNPVSMWAILKEPLFNIYIRHSLVCSKISKLCLVFMSLSIIFVEVLVVYRYAYDFVEAASKQGVPLNLVSMLCGFKRSRETFLYYFGGPFIALIVYIVSLSLLLTVPRRFSNIIENGIVDNNGLAVTMLTLDLETKGILSGIYNLQYQKGYNKFYSLLKSHVFMLVNPAAWRLGFKLQFQRFEGLANMCWENSIFIYIGLIILIPVYIFLCINEWIVIIVYFSVPLFSFFLIIIKGFWNSLRIHRVLRPVLFPFIAFGMAYNIYIFCIVFVESFLFISRILVFTLTGFIIYPNETYVYAVFLIVVTMYVVEKVNSVRLIYDDIFDRIQYICRRDKTSNSKLCITSKHGDVTLLSGEMFYYVAKRYKPFRITLCFSALNLILMTGVIYLVISIIVNLKSFQDMENLTQICTVLFICLIPKLWKQIFQRENKIEILKKNANIAKTIDIYSKQKLGSRSTTRTQVDSGNTYESTRLLRPLAESDESSDEELLFDQMLSLN